MLSFLPFSDQTAVQETDPFTICDFGTADGGTSLLLFGACVSK